MKHIRIHLPVEQIIQALKEQYDIDDDQAIECIEKYKSKLKEESNV